METKRDLDLAVISDAHLGTYGSHAKELLYYLDSIRPEVLILNGDIIDAWSFKKNKFTAYHLAVIKKIITMAIEGHKVYYITGNHDEFLRAYSPLKIHNIRLVDKLVLQIGGDKCWFFHGDIFDASIQGSRILAKIGGRGYTYLIKINRAVNAALEYFNRPRMSLSQKIKNSVKLASKYIGDFEKISADLAIDQGYDRVFCGHIHRAQIKEFENENGSVMYMNSGDWVESLSSLEYKGGKWSIYNYSDKSVNRIPVNMEIPGYEELKRDLTSNLRVEHKRVD